jgi:DNA-directed RNA polymerase II subunit RPB2
MVDTWSIIDKYFSQTGSDDNVNPLVSHQIESFNEFLDKKITQIIHGFNAIQICHNYNEEFNDFSYKIYINIINPTLTKPVFQQQDGSQIVMTPHVARMNGLTYAVNIHADIQIITETKNKDGINERNVNKVPNISFGKIPIMVRSKACILNRVKGIVENNDRQECKYDFGGYFIVNGNEKVVVSQDRISENKTVIFSANGSLNEGLTAEIRSSPDGLCLPAKTTSISMSAKPNHLGRTIRINTSFLRSEVPLFIMFRALGIETDKLILNHIVYNLTDKQNTRILEEMKATIDDSSDIYSQEQALNFLLKYTVMSGIPREYLEDPKEARKVVLNIIKRDFLPHVGDSIQRKALYLGYMVRKLLNTYLGYQPLDNRDSYLHKRIDTPGILMSNLFRQCWGKMIKEMRTAIQRELQLWRASPNIPKDIINSSNIHRFIKYSVIETGIRYALSTGNWGIKILGSLQNIRTGVAQVLNRMSYLSTLSHLRRINTPMEKNGKLVQPRKLENSQFGVICPAETPEGCSVGLVKNMSLSTRITTSLSSAYVRTCINKSGIKQYDDTITNIEEYLDTMGNSKNVHVYFNGDIIGYHDNPVELYDKMKEYKRKGNIPPTTCIAWDIRNGSIIINTEAGRMCRPLYIVDTMSDGTKKLRIEKLIEEDPTLKARLSSMTFTEYLAFLDKNEEGFIEYLDVEEIDKAMVAMFPEDLKKKNKKTYIPPNYTHCEIHPSLMLGVLACNIPFSDHNQSPRNCYQSAMGKQAVGIYMSNYNKRIDTLGHILNYPQKPLVRTKLSKFTNSDNLPSGANAIVAIMTKTGYNQEDSVMVNKGALDRGLFTSTYYKAYRDQCMKNHSTGEEEIFTKPIPTTSHIKPYNYDKLNEDGIIPKNTFVDDNDIILGKVMPHKVQGQIFPRDASITMKTNDNGHIDETYCGINSEGYKFCKIRLRNYRKPTIGDKLSSRHGQKGTIGMVYNQEDMPFNKEGICPDIIVNPHAIPSRMTVGQLIECIMGKSSAILGTYGDATPFTDCSVEKIADVLESHGLERYGNEILYNGRTGEMIKTEIFIGPTFYQRLKHMVIDKAHSRGSNGPVVMLTRQPAEGRARNGGLRFGEMERDAIVAHGASTFLKERMLDVSDNYRVFICKKCGLFCVANPERNIYKCNKCKNQVDIVQSRIPYSMKLLLQELMTMGIAPRMIT